MEGSAQAPFAKIPSHLSVEKGEKVTKRCGKVKNGWDSLVEKALDQARKCFERGSDELAKVDGCEGEFIHAKSRGRIAGQYVA
ncbi:MAG: hypothetical protein LBI61_03240 [Puniceicoccales bacterium]|jgi:hypothetical protein|nr:hypothetical protein [Puniceicoccales bacterium]